MEWSPMKFEQIIFHKVLKSRRKLMTWNAIHTIMKGKCHCQQKHLMSEDMRHDIYPCTTYPFSTEMLLVH